LLAINTAIEAAHAGIHGKGFAIIADEIRKLAENSEMQTKEIIRYIKDMYKKVQNGVRMSEQAGIAFTNINRDIEKTSNLIEEINFAMNEQKSGTNEILSSVDSVVNASIEVKNIAADLKIQSQTISDYMKDLFAVSNHINSATSEQNKGNKEILSLIANVKEISAQNKIVVHKLRGIITDFNLDSL
jgi:methyl-accepting chemotaxis protein